ncbi:MAG: hypothetical protein KAS17_11885 [Victivallaceae bacterium]|nr:hypothetical protein [Victivallaceae bacterium]
MEKQKIMLLTVLLLSVYSLVAVENESGSVGGDGSYAQRHVTTTPFTTTYDTTYTLSASPSNGYQFITQHTSVSSGTTLESNTTGGASSKKTFTNSGDGKTGFSMSLSGMMGKPGGTGGSAVSWSVTAGTEFFYIKSNQDGGAKTIFVPAGASVTYAAYENSSSKSSDWTITGAHSGSADDETSIGFGLSWWQFWNWGTPDITPPTPGAYTISASPTDGNDSDSGVMTVVGVKKINGPNSKSSVLMEAPGTWNVAQTIIVTPYADVSLSMELEPTVTMNDTVKNAISWSKPYLSTGSLEYDADSPLTATFEASSGTGEVVITASCGSSQRVIRVVVVAPKIYSVDFSGDIPIKKDGTTSTYSGVLWQDDDLDGDSDMGTGANASNKPYSPVAYESIDTMTAKGVFKIKVDNTYDKWYDVIATNAKVRLSPYSFWASMDWSAEEDLNQSGNTITAASSFFPTASPEVDYDGSFEIAWEVGFRRDPGDSLSWNRSYSENELYLTYEGSSSNFETVFHIGCTNADGEDDPGDIVSDIWSGYFEDQNVQREGREVNLKYWGSAASVLSYTRGLQNMLYQEDGRCQEWADFMKAVLEAQGITTASYQSMVTTFGPATPNAAAFLVKNWSFSTPSGTGDFPYKRAEYTEGTNSGKGNSNSQPFFADHIILTYGGTFYDPSYGITGSSQSNYRGNAVAGWSDRVYWNTIPPTNISHLSIDNGTNNVTGYNLW